MPVRILSLLALLHVSLISAAEPVRMEWTIQGSVREATVYAPIGAPGELSPLVFGFHGHGGSMANAARSFRLHEQWPDAVVVYMQGLKTPGRLSDPEGRLPGWQSESGDQNDRDLQFFDAVLTSIKPKYRIDDRRIYCTGHSNGGGFTYLLWAERGDVFAAVAPSAAVATRTARDCQPKPVMHIAGENDRLVRFAWQDVVMNRLRTINQCGAGQGWHDVPHCTLYPSSSGTPVVTLIHPGTHQYPVEAPAAIVRFFKEHRRPVSE